MKIPLVDLASQYKTIAKEVNKEIAPIMERGAFILGEEVSLFEQEFAKFCGAKFAIGVASGTDALMLSLMACGIRKGDEVITAANTFVATVEAIHLAGAKPILVDVDEENYNIDLNKIEKAINSKTKAIIPVHLYGQMVDMEKLMKIARRHRLLIIEDACQAHGATFKGKKAGSFGHAAAFSFYPGKNLGAYGDGGAVVTNSKKIDRIIRILRDHGQKKKYYHDLKGYNSRLDALQAAVLRVKLKYIDQWNKLRDKWAGLYSQLLNDTDLIIPKVGEVNGHVFHLYVVRSKKRDKLLNFLREKEIFAGIHYPIPIHLLRAFKDLKYRKGNFPVTEKIAKEIISLPIFPELDEEKVRYVVDAIKEFESKKQ